MHRIDAGTSGLILAAKTKPAMAALSTEFAERRVGKTYLALVSGTLPAEDRGRIDVPLRKTGRSVEPGQIEQGADAATTDWLIKARGDGLALIEARPLTGRMHQIRAHLADLGCPIIGDVIYGAGTPTAERLMLHAVQLDITRPDKVKLTLEAPIPSEFEDKRRALGL